ncbi:hypothetical protein L596_015522 [Steinernema carpocapsae]|uniref:Uncharacterized protein n=2 Tax=Steinernema carpocapsae TaxID=34508 RepID=A0A4U5NG83_STECR|nr:hypothetical protein L596_015522 [Steinernema carpocapsae]
MKQRFKRSDGQDHATNNSSLLLGGTTTETMTRAHRHQRPIDGSSFYTSNFPASTIVIMVISFMIVTLLILGLCGASVFFVRYLTKRKGQRELQEYRNAHPPPVPSTKEFDFALDMRLKSMEKLIPQIPQGKKPTKIDAGPKDVAGIVSFLATRKVRDEALEFRSPNTDVVLVPRTYQSAEPIIASNPFISSVRAVKAVHPVTPVVASFAPIQELRTSELNEEISREKPKKNVGKVAKKKRKTKKPKKGNSIWKKLKKSTSPETKKENAEKTALNPSPDDAKENSGQVSDSRKVNRRVGWSDAEQRHQVIRKQQTHFV